MEWVLIIFMLNNGEMVKEEQIMQSQNSCELKAAFIQEMHNSDPSFKKRVNVHLRAKCLAIPDEENV